MLVVGRFSLATNTLSTIRDTEKRGYEIRDSPIFAAKDRTSVSSQCATEIYEFVWKQKS